MSLGQAALQTSRSCYQWFVEQRYGKRVKATPQAALTLPHTTEAENWAVASLRQGAGPAQRRPVSRAPRHPIGTTLIPHGKGLPRVSVPPVRGAGTHTLSCPQLTPGRVLYTVY